MDAPEARVNVSRARDEFPDLVNRAVYARERIILSKRGKDVAAIIPIEDLRALKLAQAEMDRMDIEAGRRSLAEPGRNIPHARLKKSLGLK
jgi:prevent-host-death family protein